MPFAVPLTTTAPFLLQAADPDQPAPAGEILIWLAVIAALAAALAFFALYVRRRSLEPDAAPIGFTLADLREMHRNGELTDEEFEAAKARTLGDTRAQLASKSAGETAFRPTPQRPTTPPGPVQPNVPEIRPDPDDPADNADPDDGASN